MIAHIFISGFVQGIGFRQFVKKNADKLGLTGWVSNLPAGRQGTHGGVEAQFEGDKENIEKMLELCRKGPFLAEVKNVEVKWEENKQSDFEGFRIIV